MCSRKVLQCSLDLPAIAAHTWWSSPSKPTAVCPGCSTSCLTMHLCPMHRNSKAGSPSNKLLWTFSQSMDKYPVLGSLVEQMLRQTSE